MAKRGLIALIVVWSVLLWAPLFRSQSLRMSETVPTQEPSYFRSAFSPSELEFLIGKYPRDGALNLELLRSQITKDKPRYWTQFDALVERSPDDLLLRRAKLIDGTRARLVLPFYQPFYGTSGALLPTQKDRDEVLKWQNREQRASLVTQAREGARQAPDDAFFPWMEAMALWDRDDEPALRALERASQDSAFEDGTLAYSLALLRLKEFQGALPWDRRLWSLYVTLLPHYSQMRHLQREVVWSGIARYRTGDKVGAYRRFRIALEASGAWRRGQLNNPNAFLIGVKTSEYTQAVVWKAVATELGGATKKSTPAERLAAFAALARRDGQSALADYAIAERADFQAEKIFPGGDAYSTLFERAYQDAMGWSRTDTRLQLQLPWAGRSIYWLSAAGALALLIYLPALWLGRLLNREFVGQFSGGQTAFFGALWLCALALVAFNRRGEELLIVLPPRSREILPKWSLEAFDKAEFFWGAIATTVILAIVFCYAQRGLETRRLREQTLRRKGRSNQWFGFLWLLWLASLILASALLLVQPSGADAILLKAGWLLFTGAALTFNLVTIERRRWAHARKLRPRLGVASAFAAAISVGLLLHFGWGNDWISTVLMVSSALWAAGLPLFLLATERRWRLYFAQSLGVALQTLGGVAVVCSVALLLISLAALPVRARQNRIVDDYVAQGEIDWMKNQPSIVNARARIGK